jgi:hypothetical protein
MQVNPASRRRRPGLGAACGHATLPRTHRLPLLSHPATSVTTRATSVTICATSVTTRATEVRTCATEVTIHASVRTYRPGVHTSAHTCHSQPHTCRPQVHTWTHSYFAFVAFVAFIASVASVASVAFVAFVASVASGVFIACEHSPSRHDDGLWHFARGPALCHLHLRAHLPVHPVHTAHATENARSGCICLRAP